MIQKDFYLTNGYSYKAFRYRGDNVKIAIVVNDLELSKAGGVGSFVYELCKAFLKANQRLMLIGIINKGENDNDEMTKELITMGASAKCLNTRNQKDALLHFLLVAEKLRGILNSYADGEKIICNVHLKLATLVGGFASINNKRINVIETYHSQYSRYYLQAKITSPLIKKVICCSDSAYDEYIHRFGRKNDVYSIPNGIDMEAIRRFAANTNQQEGDSETTFYSVGRLSRQKNLPVSITGFIRCSSLKAKYYIIGDGEDKEELEHIIGNNENIQLLGNLERTAVLHRIAKADMVVMPSLWEGLSIFQLEALALGCPMMLSDISAFRQVFHEEQLNSEELFRVCKWGYLVQTNNADAWKQAFKHYAENLCLKNEMHVTVMEISNEYDIGVTVSRYLDVFHDVIGG